MGFSSCGAQAAYGIFLGQGRQALSHWTSREVPELLPEASVGVPSIWAHLSNVRVTLPLAAFTSFTSLHKYPIIREAFSPTHTQPFLLLAPSLPLFTTWHIVIVCCLFWSLPCALNLDERLECPASVHHICPGWMISLRTRPCPLFLPHLTDQSRQWKQMLFAEQGLCRKSIGRYKGAFQIQHSPRKPSCSSRNANFLNLYLLWPPLSLGPPARPVFLPFRVYVKLPSALTNKLSGTYTFIIIYPSQSYTTERCSFNSRKIYYFLPPQKSHKNIFFLTTAVSSKFH